MNIIQKKYCTIAEMWHTCMKIQNIEIPDGEYYEFSFDPYFSFKDYWRATNFDYMKSLPLIKNTVDDCFYHFNGLDFDFNGSCTLVFRKTSEKFQNYIGAYSLRQPYKLPDYSAVDLDAHLLRCIADWLKDQLQGYESWRFRNDEEYLIKELRKREVKIDAKPASIIDPSYKENGCHQRCPNGYDVYNDDWYLSPKGDMCNRCSDYFIEADQLGDDDWILHCMEKRWFDANTFIPAYWEACRRAGIKEVLMKIEY